MTEQLAAAWRATDLRPLVGASVLATAVAVIVSSGAHGDATRLDLAVLACAGVLAVALATAVDEAPATLLAPSPTTVRRRLATRTLIAAVVLLLVGVGPTAVVLAAGGQHAWARPMADLAALALLALGIAAAGHRHLPEVPGGLVAAAVLGPLGLLVTLVQPPKALATWLASLPDGAVLMAGPALGMALLGWATRDPAAPQPRLRASTR